MAEAVQNQAQHGIISVSLHQHNIQQDGLHGIESAVAAEVLVVDDPKVNCKEDSKAASTEGAQNFCQQG